VEWGLGPIKGTYRKISESRVFQVFQIVLVSQGLFETIQQYFLCILLRICITTIFGYIVQLWAEYFILQVLFVD
uniref:Uncharacterized protein n=1 Tax=Ailuropoda melanoleuca TaxID=9646 RepID=A0A7N5P5H9_AILME